MEKAVRQVWFLSVLLLGLAVPVQGQEASTHKWQTWGQVGQAQLTVLFFDVYQSQLLTPSGRYMVSGDISPHPLALNIEYQRDISRAQLISATEDEWKKLGYSDARIKNWSTSLASIFPDIQDGEQLTYVTDGDVGQFYYSQPQPQNVAMIGEISDKTLNDAFLSIWLSPETSYPKLRKQLIGKK